MGPERVRQLVDHDQPLFSRIWGDPKLLIEWKQWVNSSKGKGMSQYTQVAASLTYEDIMELLPEWFKGVVVNHPEGEQWFTGEVETLKAMLFGGQGIHG